MSKIINSKLHSSNNSGLDPHSQLFEEDKIN